MLHYIKVERLATEKHSSLMSIFISYKEKEMLRKQYGPQKLGYLSLVSPSSQMKCNTLAYWPYFQNIREMKGCE